MNRIPLLDRLREHFETLREMPGIIAEALEERRRLLETGFYKVEDLAEAWQHAERYGGRRLAEIVQARVRLAEWIEKDLGLEEWDVDLLGSIDYMISRATQAGRSAPRPRWDYVARAIPAISHLVKSDPVYVARVDRLQARIRDTYDELGLEITDETVLYVTLVSVGMMTELASTGVATGQISRQELGHIAAISQTYAAALIDYLPAEAKR